MARSAPRSGSPSMLSGASGAKGACCGWVCCVSAIPLVAHRPRTASAFRPTDLELLVFVDNGKTLRVISALSTGRYVRGSSPIILVTESAYALQGSARLEFLRPVAGHSSAAVLAQR